MTETQQEQRVNDQARILVVDDDQAIRQLLCDVMEDAGHRVISARTGVDALQQFQAEAPDLVLMDVGMPRMDGLTACAKIQELPGGPETPVILITARNDPDAIARAFQAGATDFIPKPLNLHVLKHRVRHMLRVREAERVRRLAEEQLLQSALYDALTGLPNRRLLFDRMRHALARTRRPMEAPTTTPETAHHPGASFAVLFLDLDRFKTINDSLGHLMGDRLLIDVAHRLEAVVRPGDTVARLGGDEFVVLLDGISDLRDAERTAERIHEALRIPFELEGTEVVTGTSIGIALSGQGYTQPDELLRDADIAMYRAKTQGRARHEVFDSRLHAEALAQLRLENELRRAIERQEFVLYYQPIVSLETNHILGVEALIRWQHPQRGLLLPGEFLALAEEIGLMGQIGAWVLRTACEQAARWRKGTWSDLTISINLSARQFKVAGLEILVDQVLADTELPPEALILELTESSIMNDPATAGLTLGRMAARHIQVAIDDFGTGYSSLSYLLHLPITSLKIDKSFVANLSNGYERTPITSAIIAMARQLKLNVVAEGVETAAQLEFLREHGCDTAQGTFISPPMPAAMLSASFSMDGV